MGVAVSLLIFAAGAVMRFAVTATSPDFSVRTVGAILMIVGGMGFVVSLLFWGTWGGIGSVRRERRIVRRGPVSSQSPGADQRYGGTSEYQEEEIRQLS